MQHRTFTLLSTVVAPSFAHGELTIIPVPAARLAGLLGQVGRNLCGHPLTDRVLRTLHPGLPEPERGFWDGETAGLAVRPIGGVRGAQATGDTEVGIDGLEACMVEWAPGEPAHYSAAEVRAAAALAAVDQDRPLAKQQLLDDLGDRFGQERASALCELAISGYGDAMDAEDAAAAAGRARSDQYYREQAAKYHREQATKAQGPQ